jgi:hypothetical protein
MTGMFDDIEENEDEGSSFVMISKKDQIQKKTTKLLADSDEEDELRPTKRSEPKFAEAPKKKGMFGDSSEEEETSFKPKPLPVIG